jgi:hypothetical protein
VIALIKSEITQIKSSTDSLCGVSKKFIFNADTRGLSRSTNLLMAASRQCRDPDLSGKNLLTINTGIIF